MRALCRFTSLNSFRVKVMFQKQTPKELLHSVESSLCRVCANVCDKCHSNNLFSERNCVLLAVAETLHGKPLPQGDFRQLVCRPCSRKLNNTKLLQDQIHKSQASFESNLGERFKRCIEISPSAPKTIKSLKSHSPLAPREGRHNVGKMDSSIFCPEITYGMLRIVI